MQFLEQPSFVLYKSRHGNVFMITEWKGATIWVKFSVEHLKGKKYFFSRTFFLLGQTNLLFDKQFMFLCSGETRHVHSAGNCDLFRPAVWPDWGGLWLLFRLPVSAEQRPPHQPLPAPAGLWIHVRSRGTVWIWRDRGKNLEVTGH